MYLVFLFFYLYNCECMNELIKLLLVLSAKRNEVILSVI